MGTPVRLPRPAVKPVGPGRERAGTSSSHAAGAAMSKHGFRPYDKEWWDFTLQGEPFRDTLF